MPTIRFVKNLAEIHVEEGATLMTALLKAGLPVASSCHGDGVCAKCRIVILSGSENLSKVESGRTEFCRDRLRIPREVRISCQTRVLGDIVVDAGYW
ncbi:MAG: (2Fe-2S)-binding protein [Calothrix sp. SM1_5_4]|nr:(2Fe-2S)-binding protein [Calothrix sp. SM1_5_4]